MKKLFETLASVKLAITLLVVLLLSSALGSLIIQGGHPAGLQEKYGWFAFHLLKFTGAFDLYHSFWFLGLLALLWLNLLFCSLKRLGPLLRSMRKERRRKKASHLEAYGNRLAVKASTWAGEPMECARASLAARGYRLFYEGKTLYGRRGLIGRYGAYVTHLGLLVVMAGAMIGGIAGFRGYLRLDEGQSRDWCSVGGEEEKVNLGFEIRLNKFDVEFYDDGRPKEFRSNLSIIRDGKELVRKVIEVNDPLTFEGITFYQTDYGRGRGYLATLPGRMGARSAGGKLGKGSVEIAGYYPDFVRDKEKGYTRSKLPNNPAVKVHYHGPEGRAGTAWAFYKFPDFSHDTSAPYIFQLVEGKQAGTYELKVYGQQQGYYSGLQVVRDPSVPAVYTGCVILVLGLFLSFYVPFRRVWVVAEGGKMHLAAATSERRSMEGELRSIAREVRGRG